VDNSHIGTGNRQVRVAKRAIGVPSPDVFSVVDAALPSCPPDGVLVRVMFAAVDPAMRGWLSSETNYLTVATGAVMRAEGIGEVVESRHSDWHRGDWVYGSFGWQRFCAAGVSDLRWRIDPSIAPPAVWLGALGLNGLTAWIGLNHFGRPRSGEVIVVSTAAGAVGSVVAGLARAAGLRTVGITRGAAKITRCIETLKYDAAIDYGDARSLGAAVAAACPDGVDIFYDNTAGAIADAVFPVLKRGARVVQCGTVAVQNWLDAPAGPRRERDILVKRLSWHGFVVIDHENLYPEARADLQRAWLAGKLDAQTEILDGLDAAPGSIRHLYEGHNTGRLCIRP
jgi:NADPH-dependent curcumin reductase CurA